MNVYSILGIEHFPIAKPTVAQLIQLSLEEKQVNQKNWLRK